MKVYCLTETVERDGIRDFNILQVYADKEKAIEEMNKCVDEDPYGDFKSKGFETQTEMCCESKYDEGFTGYTVVELILNSKFEEAIFALEVEISQKIKRLDSIQPMPEDYTFQRDTLDTQRNLILKIKERSELDQ